MTSLLTVLFLYSVLSLFGVSWSIKVFDKYSGMQCTGSLPDILRDFEGTSQECQDKCILLDGCIGFVRVNSGSQYEGKCYFRGGILSDPVQYTADDRDCYTSERFVKNEGMQCVGSIADILRDFEGNARECAEKCVELDDCVGFIRVNSGSQYEGNCYFRGGILSTPQSYDGDDRDCYVPVGDGASYNQLFFAKNTGYQCTGSDTDILRDFEGTQPECKKKCRSLDECVGFVRVNSGSQYEGKCYFRGGTLSQPQPYNGDNRDCFEPVFFRKYVGSQCTGSDADILRDFVGSARDCKRRCSNIDGCVGFVRVNSGSQYEGKCYFRGGTLSAATTYNGDNRDCYEAVYFEKYERKQCVGSSSDIVRDFIGTARECQQKCAELTGCVGFVRVNSGSEYAGKCYFRGGILSDPESYNGDDRDCYQVVTSSADSASIPLLERPYDDDNNNIYFVVHENTVILIGGILVLLLAINVIVLWRMNKKNKDIKYKVVKYINTDIEN